jgi:hypothetical protein
MMALVSEEDLRRPEASEQGATETWSRREAALAAAARAAIRAERHGVPLPDSGETLAHLREERVHKPADLR